MRFTFFAVMTVISLVWVSAAQATEIMTHKRTVEYKIVEPCDVLVAEGEVVLEWTDCGGDYELVTIDYEDFGHPLTLVFAAGAPDFSTLSDDCVWSFLCHPKVKKYAPDVYCMDCNPCAWYSFYNEACFCGEIVCAHAYLPKCMALQIVDVY
jgi:hypothetical protein